MKNIYNMLFLVSAILFSSNLSYTRSIEYPIKAIIFDLDGTIVDSEQFWFSMLLKVLEGYNIILDDDGQKELETVKCGNTIEFACKWIVNHYVLDCTYKDIENEYCRNVCKYHEGKITFVPGFESFFEKASRYPLRFAIATNSGLFSLGITEKSVNLRQKFGEHIYHRNLVAQIKPAPDIYLHAAKQINVEPHECLAIEDSATGIKSAQAAGMFCIGLNRGDRSKVAQADLIVDAYDEIDIETLLKGDTAQLRIAHS